MKLKTYEEQLREEQDKAWKCQQFLSYQRSGLFDKVNKEESRIFINKGRVRVIRYEITEYDQAIQMISNYRDQLETEINSVKAAKTPPAQ